jgi:hypothetical protein
MEARDGAEELGYEDYAVPFRRVVREEPVVRHFWSVLEAADAVAAQAMSHIEQPALADLLAPVLVVAASKSASRRSVSSGRTAYACKPAEHEQLVGSVGRLTND